MQNQGRDERSVVIVESELIAILELLSGGSEYAAFSRAVSIDRLKAALIARFEDSGQQQNVGRSVRPSGVNPQMPRGGQQMPLRADLQDGLYGGEGVDLTQENVELQEFDDGSDDGSGGQEFPQSVPPEEGGYQGQEQMQAQGEPNMPQLDSRGRNMPNWMGGGSGNQVPRQDGMPNQVPRMPTRMPPQTQQQAQGQRSRSSMPFQGRSMNPSQNPPVPPQSLGGGQERMEPPPGTLPTPRAGAAIAPRGPSKVPDKPTDDFGDFSEESF